MAQSITLRRIYWLGNFLAIIGFSTCHSRRLKQRAPARVEEKDCQAGYYGSDCIPCGKDPDGTSNGLSCLTCSLDSEARVPMCTSCAGGLLSQVKGKDAAGHTRWLCEDIPFEYNKVPGLCEPDAVDPSGSRSQAEEWSVYDVEDGRSLFSCTSNQHKESPFNKRLEQARDKEKMQPEEFERRLIIKDSNNQVLKAAEVGNTTLWPITAALQDYIKKPVKMKMLEDGLDNRRKGLPETLTIALAIFPKDHLATSQVASSWFDAERVLAFHFRREDHWIRCATYLNRIERSEVERSDDHGCVWYLRDVTEDEKGRLEVEVGFAKNAVDYIMHDTDVDKDRLELEAVSAKRAVECSKLSAPDARWQCPQIGTEDLKDPPRFKFSEATMRALGACTDYWVKRRKPHHLRPISKASYQMFLRAASILDSKMGSQDATAASATTCPYGQYCTLGNGPQCDPPGRCLPCSLDYDGEPNGLHCVSCKNILLNRIRFSVPTCPREACTDPEELIDFSGARQRTYCRPDPYIPGVIPGLCAAPVQGGARVSSRGDMWWRLVRNTTGKLKWERMRVRFLPETYPRVYFATFPLYTPGTLDQESEIYWAAGTSIAEQMLTFELGKADKLLLRDTMMNCSACLGRASQEASIFKLLDMVKSMDQSWDFVVAFNRRMWDEKNQTWIGEDANEFKVSLQSMLALGACMESFQNDHPPDALQPKPYLDALEVAAAASPEFKRWKEQNPGHGVVVKL